MLISLDTETTGLDLWHGCKPFYISTCDEKGNQKSWEWDVNPLTREVNVIESDLQEIKNLIQKASNIVGQNLKFDVHALKSVGIIDFPWYKVHDTLIAGHLLSSNTPHDLTSMVTRYLGHAGVDIYPYESALEKAVKEARRVIQQASLRNERLIERSYDPWREWLKLSKKTPSYVVKDKMEEEGLISELEELQKIDLELDPLGDWKIARDDDPMLPSGRGWGADYWLPRALALHLSEGKDVGEDESPDWLTWFTPLSEYGDADTASTMMLWKELEAEIRRRNLWKIYEERMRVLPVAWGMEDRGITINGERLRELRDIYREESDFASTECLELAREAGFELDMPKGAAPNNSLREFVFDKLKMEKKYGEKGKGILPSLAKDVIEGYIEELPEMSLASRFFKTLQGKRKRDSNLSYMENYERFWIPFTRSKQFLEEDERDKELLDIPESGKENTDVNSLPKKTVLHLPIRLSKNSRTNTPKDESVSQLRRSPVCKPETLISRNTEGQFRRHEKQRKICSRGKTPESEIDWKTSNLDKKLIHSQKPEIRGSSIKQKVQSREDANKSDYKKGTLDQDLSWWYVLHSRLNPTATDTLRWSSSNPNEQNISKKGVFFGDVKTLRYLFGPAPGREWWSLDAKNMELRIPAFESGEQSLIDLFERPNDPPYYGSEHLLNFSIVYPDIWEEELRAVGVDKVGPHIKKKYETTNYHWVKIGGFAMGYGAVDNARGTGTADRGFRRPGSQARLKSRFDKKERLNQKYIRDAERTGYVETIPDRSIDPERGYPLMCSRTEYGRIKPTVPLNYHVQSTAMWWTMRAMNRVQGQLDEWWGQNGFDGHIVMQVHDELVLDLPALGDPVGDHDRTKKNPRHRGTSNLRRIRVVQKLMEQGGADIGVKTPTGCEYHKENWSEGVTL